MKLTVVKRTCGECRACCTTCAVNELDKPINTACVHLCERGCGIYGSRPQSCRDYDCAWLQGHLSDEERPDRTGIVWSFEQIEGFEGLLAQAMLMHEEVPLDRVQQQYKMLGQSMPQPLRLQIVPHWLHVEARRKIAGREVSPGVWVAVGEAPG